jgi:hypothetical protein
MHRAHAAHYQAEIAFSRGDAEGALAACDRALAALAAAQGDRKPLRPPPSPPAWDYVRAVASQRALSLAMLGRHDEALAELDWANGMPTELPGLRVGLVKPLREQQYATAARLFDARDPALLLPIRDELLGDLVRFVARPAARSEHEAARLRAELLRDPGLSRWLAATAPGLEAAFEKAADVST